MEDEILINNVNIPKMDQVYNLLKSTNKIEVGPNKFGSGFFIKFKKNNGKIFYCLMTNKHVINPEIIKQKKKIKILYENEKKTLIIELDQEDRFIKYFEDSLQIDVTVVQILDMDNIGNDYFLEPNDDYKKGYQQFNDKTISVVQYPLGEQLSMSNGIIKYSENNTFAHTASTLHGSSGGPIVLEGSDKVLGIHKGGNNFEKENYGDFIGPVIDDIKKFERNGFGKDFYKNGDIKYMGNFINDKYDDDNGLFYYEEGYKDDIYYYEKGEYFNGKFKEGKKIEGKIYDKNDEIKFVGSFKNDIPIIDTSDCYNNDNKDEDNKDSDKDNDNNNIDENDSDKNDKDNNSDNSEENDDDRRNKEESNINPVKNETIIRRNENYNNNSNNNITNKVENNNDKEKGKILTSVKKFIYNRVDLIKDYIPIPIKCRACRHKIQSHTKIGDAQWSCSECSDDSICYVK